MPATVYLILVTVCSATDLILDRRRMPDTHQWFAGMHGQELVVGTGGYVSKRKCATIMEHVPTTSQFTLQFTASSHWSLQDSLPIKETKGRSATRGGLGVQFLAMGVDQSSQKLSYPRAQVSKLFRSRHLRIDQKQPSSCQIQNMLVGLCGTSMSLHTHQFIQ